MQKNRFLNKPFDLLDSFKDRLFFVLFITTYLILFLTIYKPFNLEDWYIFSGGNQTLALVLLGFIGGVYYSFSQLIMRKVIKFPLFTVKHFAMWTLVEILLLTLLLTIIYDDVEGVWTNIFEYLSNLKYAFFTLVLPYSFALSILSLFKSRTEIIELRSAQKPDELENTLIKFPDENGNVKVSILSHDVLYLVSSDNYVDIYYLADGRVRKELIRNSLKKLELFLEGKSIKRCHRSYMINVENIAMIKKSGQKLKLKLNHIETFLPISKSYNEQFKSYIG
ncbi:transcriptional regulator, LytTR family [Saccharicrinis carchari]|uniref:Transcriptional regulator, LytTR family n=1 Tax=Saccharicrinis carchari TaxID=1168039 RepID=A0A521D1V5_SACCC|nr:LytTR family DNA-binding domain-containing protein [Saccharicrinis carchari]SMO65664.1 transcriptional regulator, LytTR family [Saccharicrinis carchari]